MIQKTLLYILLYSPQLFSSEVNAKTLNTPQETRTPTLFETIANSFKDQSLNQYAYTLSVGTGFIKGVDSDLNRTNHMLYGVQIGLRAWKNIWIEGAYYYQGNIQDLPEAGLIARIESIIGRIRYNIELSPNFHIQPYVGFHSTKATAPGAGHDASNFLTQEEMDNEEYILSENYKNNIILGTSFFGKLWRGYTTRLDIGTDILAINIGHIF